jgi:hypothetical protein
MKFSAPYLHDFGRRNNEFLMTLGLDAISAPEVKPPKSRNRCDEFYFYTA